jgi:hypothetical protein
MPLQDANGPAGAGPFSWVRLGVFEAAGLAEGVPPGGV